MRLLSAQSLLSRCEQATQPTNRKRKKIFAFRNKNSPEFQNYLWTFLASGMSAVYVAMMVLITARVVGIAEAGMVSFSIATIRIFSYIILAVRSFQSTDIRQEYSLNTYVGMRICSVVFASAFFLLFILISRFDTSRTFLLLLFYFVYLVDGIADVFMGDLQQKGKMRVAGRMRATSFGLSLLASAAIMYITQSLIVPVIFSGIVVFITYIVWIWCYRRHFVQLRVKFDVPAIKKLASTGGPVLITTVAYIYLLNAQKYYLGFFDSDESVAIITMLMQPVTMLNLFLGSFFAGAELTKTAETYIFGDKKLFSRRIHRQLSLAASFAAVFLLCCFTFGIPLLSWLYNVYLFPFTREFTMIALLGAVFAIFMPLSGGTMAMRQQKVCMYVMLVMATWASAIMWFMVSGHGITGAVISNLLIYIPLVVAYFAVYRTGLRRMKPAP